MTVNRLYDLLTNDSLWITDLEDFGEGPLSCFSKDFVLVYNLAILEWLTHPIKSK